MGALLFVVALAVTGCSASGTVDAPAPSASRSVAPVSASTSQAGMSITLSPSDVAGIASAMAATPTCASLLGESDWVKVLDKAGGCMETKSDQLEVSRPCLGGSRLFTFGTFPYYWGVSTGSLHTVAKRQDLDTLPAFKAAYDKCVGNS